MKKILLLLLLSCSLTAYGQDTLSHIYGGCINQARLTGEDTCPEGIHFSYENDSLTIFGTISANCCGTHLAVIEKLVDAVYISTVDTGMLCTCTCEYCFSIKIPASTNDTMVNLNGSVYDISRVINSIKNPIDYSVEIFPNPARSEITVRLFNHPDQYERIELIDAQGLVVKVKQICRESQISLNLSKIPKGTYFIRLMSNKGGSITKKVILE